MLKNKGNEAFTKNDFQTAIQFYMQTLKHNPHHDGAWNNMGLAYRSMDDYKSAIKCFRKAIELNPNNGSALANKEACEYELNRELLGLKKKSENKPIHVATPTPVATTPPRSEAIAAQKEDASQPVEADVKEKVTSSASKSEAASPRESRMTALLDKASEVLSSAPITREEKKEPEVVATVPFIKEEKRVEPKPEVKETEVIEENVPPPPETMPEEETVVSRKIPKEEKYIVEERMGPLGLRPTVVIRTEAERGYVEEYRKQRSPRTGFPYYEDQHSPNEEVEVEAYPTPPSDHGEPLIEVKAEVIEPLMTRAEEQRSCEYCRNPISGENRSIRCVWCGSFFCSACERDFRGEREKGEKAVCAKCFIREIKEKERGKLEKEKERKRREKLEEQSRLREKLDEERRLRENLEEERRKMRGRLEEERRKKERLEEEQRFRDRLEEEKRRMLERFEEERRVRQAMEREFMLKDRVDLTQRKRDWVSSGLPGKSGYMTPTKISESVEDEMTSLMIEDLEDEIAGLGRFDNDETSLDFGGGGGSMLNIGNRSIYIGPGEDVFEVLSLKFESGEITSEEYEKLIEDALEG